jgi:glycosyltransferase involved in cell wall biosynthesis
VKNILIITPVNPLLPINGGSIGTNSHVIMLQDSFRVSVIYPGTDNENFDSNLDKKVNIYRYTPTILRIGLVRKIYNLLLSTHILLGNKTNQKNNKIIDDVESSKYAELFKKKPKELIDLIIHVIEKDNIDFVEIHFIQWADIVYWLPGHVKKIFVHHELRTLRLQTWFDSLSKEVQSKKKYEFSSLYNFILAQEERLLEEYDEVIFVSDLDKQYLINNTKLSSKNLHHLPPVLAAIKTDLPEKSYSNLKFWFVGGADHPPNREGIFWFLDLIKDHVEIFKNFLPISITGHWPPEWRSQIESKYGDFAVVDGYVKDYDAHSNGKILVCPVRIGSGIRIKLVTAMAKNIPIITTPAGAMGINLTDKENALFFNNLNDLISCLPWLSSPEKLSILTQNSSLLYNIHYNYNVVKQKKELIYLNLQ